MTFIAPTCARALEPRSRPFRSSAGAALPSGAAEKAADFAEVLAVALEDALAALAHRSPEQYLHLAGARRREAAQAETRVPGPGRHGVRANEMRRDRAVVQELSLHLAFEILGAARRYSAFIVSLGEREERIPPGCAISGSPHTPEGGSRSPRC